MKLLIYNRDMLCLLFTVLATDTFTLNCDHLQIFHTMGWQGTPLEWENDLYGDFL